MSVSRRAGAGRRLGGRGRAGTAAAAASPSLFDQVKAIYAIGGGYLFDADYYSVDGGTGKVAAFVDYNDVTHALAQSDGPQQVAVTTAEALVNGALVARFLGGQSYVSNRAASTFAYHHDGSGGDMNVGFIHRDPSVIGGPNRIVGTRTTSTGTTGASLEITSQNGATEERVLFQITSNAALVVNNTGTAGLINKDVPTYLQYSYKEAASPEWTQYTKGSASHTGSSLVTPTLGGAPTHSLRLGDTSTAGRDATMDWFFLAGRPSPLTGAERLIVQAYLLSKYAITA